MTDTQPQSPAARSSVLSWLLVAAAVMLMLVVVNWRQQGSVGTALNHRGVGQKLAGVELQALTGDSRPLGVSDLEGHVVLLNIWGTWCGPCRLEFPHLIDIARHFSKNEAFLPVLVSCGYGEDSELDSLRDETKAFLESEHVELPIYADRGGVTRRQLGAVTGWEGYPFTVLLDRHGVIRAVWDGYFPGSEAQMEKLIAELLSADGKSG